MCRKKSHNAAINDIQELVYSEHVSGCDQKTCDISSAWNSGHGLWASYIFSSSGAASEEFYKALKKIPKKVFDKIAENERKQFVKTPHYECPNCDAIVWDINSELLSEEEIFCDDCGKFFCPRQLSLEYIIGEKS